MKPWTLSVLKEELNRRPEIKGWILSQEHVHRRERYFLSDTGKLAIDQDRDTRSQSLTARIFVRLPESPSEFQGEITQKLFPHLPLGPQLDRAIASALLTRHQAWDLGKLPEEQVPTLKTSDPRIAEDMDGVLDELTDQIASVVAREKAATFNSSELFLSLHDRELHLSNGQTHRSSQSRVYVEAAYSASDSDEYLNTQWSVSLGDLSIEKLFKETCERARNTLKVSPPETGRYPVLIDSEVLSTLFNGQVSQLSGVNAYNKLPFLKPGEELIPGATQDLLTLSLDPWLEYGADTAALSDSGAPQKPLLLVERNRVVATATDTQHASYLHVPRTTSRGSVVVQPGSLSYSELTRSAPRVIEILQFSGLFADSASGTFGSEIRLARLFDNEKGTVTYLRGGSLSGSIRENFRGARLSRELAKRAHFTAGSSQGHGYFGPEYALLSDVSIVG